MPLSLSEAETADSQCLMIYIPTSLSHPPHMLNLFFPPAPYSLISPRLFSTFLPDIERSRPVEERSGRRPTRGSRTSLSVASKDPLKEARMKELAARVRLYKSNACASLTARQAVFLYFFIDA